MEVRSLKQEEIGIPRGEGCWVCKVSSTALLIGNAMYLFKMLRKQTFTKNFVPEIIQHIYRSKGLDKSLTSCCSVDVLSSRLLKLHVLDFIAVVSLNPHVTNGLFHLYNLDESI